MSQLNMAHMRDTMRNGSMFINNMMDHIGRPGVSGDLNHAVIQKIYQTIYTMMSTMMQMEETINHTYGNKHQMPRASTNGNNPNFEVNPSVQQPRANAFRSTLPQPATRASDHHHIIPAPLSYSAHMSSDAGNVETTVPFGGSKGFSQQKHKSILPGHKSSSGKNKMSVSNIIN
ncbi:hypothetical protein LX36DRAFT_294270 [Colletotrichum falcatum]|nr:hypothetical protein LX36DRAFT_294270 [Colletotrichum falcatum]